MKCPRCDGTGIITLEDVRVGDLIEQYRKAVGMTQEQLSIEAGIGRSQIANVESGRSDMPIKMLQRIAKALGCSTKDLVP